MANPIAMIDSSFPTFRGDESPQEVVRVLENYIFELVQALQFQLSNLDERNFNQNSLDTIKLDATKDVTQQVKDLTQAGQLLQQAVKDLQSTVQQLNQTVEGNSSGIRNNATAIQSLRNVVAPDGKGGGTIGTNGQTINLVGTVLVNGVPI